MIKKFFLLLLILFGFGVVFAFEPSTQDQAFLEILKDKYSHTYKSDPQKVEDIYNKASLFQNRFENNPRMNYFVGSLIDILEKILDQDSLYNNANIEYFDFLEVIDGDTVKILYSGNETNVRLIGVDAPEKSTYRYGYVECFGKEATRYLSGIIQEKKIGLEFDKSQGIFDKYGRLLAYIRYDGVLINSQLIKNGYAWEYTYNLPYKYTDNFKDSEDFASLNKLGLWSADACGGKRIATEKTVDKKIENKCSEKKYCSEMISCDEAKFFLKECGLDNLDRDGDGTPCENLCGE